MPKILLLLFTSIFSSAGWSQQIYSFSKNKNIFFGGTTAGDIILIKNDKSFFSKKIATHTITAVEKFKDGFLFTGNNNSFHQISANGYVRKYVFPAYLSVVTSIKKQGDIVLLGHYSGYLSLWKIEKERLLLKNILDLKRPNLAFGYLSDAIYAIDIYNVNKAVVGTDSGWLFVISLASEEILAEKPYSYWSSRGINSISIKNNLIVVGTCQNSTKDQNVFIFKLVDNSPFQISTAVINAFNPGDNNFVFKVAWLNDENLIASTSYGINYLNYNEKKISHITSLSLNLERFASSFYIDNAQLFIPDGDYRIKRMTLK